MTESPLGPFREKQEHYKVATNYLLWQIINNLQITYKLLPPEQILSC